MMMHPDADADADASKNKNKNKNKKKDRCFPLSQHFKIAIV